MLPLPLGEGRGEGIAEQCTNSYPYFLPVRRREERTKRWLASLSPHPSPLPKGEGDLQHFRRSFLMSIEDWRTEINALDIELLRLLNQRARIALRVGASKAAEGLSLCDHTREREVIERMCGANEGPLDDRAIVELFRAVIHESRRIQTRALDQSSDEQAAPKPKLDHGQVRIAFQGAPGAFSEEAAVKLLGEEITLVPRPTFESLFAAI